MDEFHTSTGPGAQLFIQQCNLLIGMLEEARDIMADPAPRIEEEEANRLMENLIKVNQTTAGMTVVMGEAMRSTKAEEAEMN